MSSILHRFPQEILTRIARESATSPGGGFPTAPSNLARVDKYLHRRLALSSIFRPPELPFFRNDDTVNPAALTHSLLWADIFKDNFSYSAVSRRSFTPSIHGYAIQLVVYCRLLHWLRTFDIKNLEFKDESPDGFENRCLELIFLMLLECDGKNTCQLEWAGAYEYCKQWLLVKLFPADEATGKLADCWPRDDRYVAYALWNTWLLTSHDRLAAETNEQAIYLQDIVFRFAFCSWAYPHSYAPLSRYTLPFDAQHGLAGSSIVSSATNPHTSVASTLPYPLYRTYDAAKSCLNTQQFTIQYFGRSLSWSPPLLTSPAKLLFNCRADSIPIRPPEDLPLNREVFFQQHQAEIQRRLAENPTLSALYDFVQVRGVGHFDWMVEHTQLPHHFYSLPGLQQAIHDVRDITGLHGVNPAEAVQITQADLIQSNAHRETALPFRGGWDEDGLDPQNRRWTKTLVRDKQGELPPIRRMDKLGLPYPCTQLSMTHDSFFWRLRMCGDPADDRRSHLFDFLGSEELSKLAINETLRNKWNRLVPGRTWTSGLLNGLFRGALWYPPDTWLLDSYRSNSFSLPAIGDNIIRSQWIPRLHFVGRLQEHHLQGGNSTVPFTCDSRTFPLDNTPPDHGSDRRPIVPFAQAIYPDEQLLVDEGGMNAWLPANFRCSHDTAEGRPLARFAWGPKGTPSADRITRYETFIPGMASSHRSESCPTCRQKTEFLDHVREKQQELDKVESLFRQFGLSPKQNGGDTVLRDDAHSSRNVFSCDGIADIIITGETDLEHGQAWYHYNYLGRVRKWDGLVCILRIPKHPYARLPTMLFYGYFESDLNFVGSWRHVAGDRIWNPNFSVPTVYLPENGLNGIGLLGRGGAGVLGDGMRVVREGPFTMSKVAEDDN